MSDRGTGVPGTLTDGMDWRELPRWEVPSNMMSVLSGFNARQFWQNQICNCQGSYPVETEQCPDWDVRSPHIASRCNESDWWDIDRDENGANSDHCGTPDVTICYIRFSRMNATEMSAGEKVGSDPGESGAWDTEESLVYWGGYDQWYRMLSWGQEK